MYRPPLTALMGIAALTFLTACESMPIKMGDQSAKTAATGPPAAPARKAATASSNVARSRWAPLPSSRKPTSPGCWS